MRDLHHANVLVGLRDCRDFLAGFLKNNLGFDLKRNPDFFTIENQFLGIDDARAIELWAAGKPLLGDTKVCFVDTTSITFEAQNALLKVLEEPTLGTYFFINIPNLGNILPTFLSRVRILNYTTRNIEESKDAALFLQGEIKKKLQIIKTKSSKESSDLKNFLNELESLAYRENLNRNIVKNILTAKVFAAARGSSPKMLLEWLSFVL